MKQILVGGDEGEGYSPLFGPEYYIDNDKLKSATNKYFSGRFNEVNSYLDISHRLLHQLPEYTNPKFIKNLFEEHSMKITKTISISRLVANYKLSFDVRSEENGISWYVKKEFQTEDGQYSDEGLYEIRDKMDEFYEDYRKKELRRIMKRTGGLTAVGLSLIALITGLSLDLEKRRNELIVEPPKKHRN